MTGFESSSSTEILGWVPMLPNTIHQPMETAYDCPLNYWTDESCGLYNSSLVYPPPMMDSFSEAYLHQASRYIYDTNIIHVFSD